jgi:hypothetical protein
MNKIAIIKALAKISDHLDNIGFVQAATELDDVIVSLVSNDKMSKESQVPSNQMTPQQKQQYLQKQRALTEQQIKGQTRAEFSQFQGPPPSKASNIGHAIGGLLGGEGALGMYENLYNVPGKQQDIRTQRKLFIQSLENQLANNPFLGPAQKGQLAAKILQQQQALNSDARSDIATNLEKF